MPGCMLLVSQEWAMGPNLECGGEPRATGGRRRTGRTHADGCALFSPSRELDAIWLWCSRKCLPPSKDVHIPVSTRRMNMVHPNVGFADVIKGCRYGKISLYHVSGTNRNQEQEEIRVRHLLAGRGRKENEYGHPGKEGTYKLEEVSRFFCRCKTLRKSRVFVMPLCESSEIHSALLTCRTVR